MEECRYCSNTERDLITSKDMKYNKMTFSQFVSERKNRGQLISLKDTALGYDCYSNFINYCPMCGRKLGSENDN